MERAKRIEELRAKAREALQAAETLLDTAETEERSLSDEEQATYDAKLAEVDTLKAQIERHEKLLAEERALEPPAEPVRPVVRPVLDDSGQMPSRAPAAHVRSDDEYSLLRLVNYIGARSMGGWAEEPKTELRASAALAEFYEKEPQGIFVPPMALLPWEKRMELSIEERQVGKGTPNTDGAALVGTDHMWQMFIEALRNEAVALRLGATTLPGLVGDVSIPRQSGTGTMAWVAENAGDSTDSNLATDAVTLTPRTGRIRQSATRRLSKQSQPAIESLMAADIRAGIGLGIDLAVFVGGGGDAPQGIYGATGVQNIVVATYAAMTWDVVNEFEKKLGEANANRGRVAWAFTSAWREKMKTTEKATNTAQFLMPETGTNLNSYPVGITQQLIAANAPTTATDAIVYGNFADVLVGFWGGLDLMADPYTDADKGGIVLRGFQDVDVALRHGVSFVTITNA